MKAPLLWAAPAFSLALSIGGIDVPHFNNLQISYTADGYGARGVCSQQLTFDVPACDYDDDTVGLFPYGAEVLVSCGTEVPVFYVSSRKPSGGRLSFTCYDRAMFTSAKCTLEESDFTAEEDSSGGDSSSDSDSNCSSGSSNSSDKKNKPKFASVSAVLANIKSICGFTEIAAGDIIGTKITKCPKDKVFGRTAKEILSDLAEAACGCFFVQGGVLTFLPFACGASSALFSADKYSSIEYGLTKVCGSVIMTDGSRTYASGGDTDAYHTMKISSVYASEELAGAVIGAIQNKSYRAWSCRALVSTYPAPGAGITFGESVLVTNFCRLRITDFGLYAEMGRNSVQENEYDPLADRVQIGEVNGSTKMTRQGIKFVNENSKTEYGFEMAGEGVARFAGAILNGMMPTAVKIAEDGKSLRANYNGKIFEYAITEDNDGNIIPTTSEVSGDG